MTIKKFEGFSKFLSSFLLLSGIISLLNIGFILFIFITRSEGSVINSPVPTFTIFKAQMNHASTNTKLLSGLVTGILVLLVYFYIFLKGSHFFKRLSQGQTPFSLENYKTLKEIGLVLSVTSFITPLLYSLIMTLNMPDGYYFLIGIDSDLLIGLLIYCMAEVIRYGVTLQSLSDETV